MTPHPAPFVLDLSVLNAVARFDASTVQLVMIYSGRAQPMRASSLAMAGAIANAATKDAEALVWGLTGLGVRVVPLKRRRHVVNRRGLSQPQVSIRGMRTRPQSPTRRCAPSLPSIGRSGMGQSRRFSSR